MRLIATFFTLVALAAASLAGKDLHAALSQATPQVTPEDLTRAVQEVATPSAPAEPLIWPALFGEPEPPKPPTPPQAPVQVVEQAWLLQIVRFFPVYQTCEPVDPLERYLVAMVLRPCGYRPRRAASEAEEEALLARSVVEADVCYCGEKD